MLENSFEVNNSRMGGVEGEGRRRNVEFCIK